MAVPKSVVKINKDGVFYESSVDRTKYTILELERAALRDVAKFLRRDVKKRVPKDEGDARKNIATWVKKPFRGTAAHLSIGVYNKATAKKKGLNYVGFYFHILEFGSRLTRAFRPLRGGVFENVKTIRDIQAQYLKNVEDEQKAFALINEEEVVEDK